MDYAEFMNTAFYVCVFILRWGALKLSMTYEALNIWIFVVIHPLMTAFFLYKWMRVKSKLAHHSRPR
tara:strand:+ start:582 stop:782 length:201 start_codon:yes stop_codon:yes gene_type:complete